MIGGEELEYTDTPLNLRIERRTHIGYGHATDTRKSVSDTSNEVSNILIFFRTRGHGKDTEGTRQGVKDTFF